MAFAPGGCDRKRTWRSFHSRPRSTALDAERKRISQELQNEPPASKEVALHPAVLKRYEEQLNRLEEASGKSVTGDAEAAEAIRDLVDTVTVFRDPARPGGVAVEIAGRPNALLGEAAYLRSPDGIPNLRFPWPSSCAGASLSPFVRKAGREQFNKINGSRRCIAKQIFSGRREIGNRWRCAEEGGSSSGLFSRRDPLRSRHALVGSFRTLTEVTPRELK